MRQTIGSSASGWHGVVVFLRKNVVLAIAFMLAAVSAILVPPDAAYKDYFDTKTLGCLFGTLAVVCALKRIRFFSILARRIIQLTGNMRVAAVALVYITFIGSMLIANDMALITFLPLGYLVFAAAGRRRDVATVFILQNIAANLGGMLTPFGNPQNLYLYAHFAIPTGEFMSIMLIPFIVAIVLVTACCLFVPDRKFKIEDKGASEKLPFWRTTLYLTLFAMTILMVFRVLPLYIVLIVVVVVLLIADRKALGIVDYGLLGTFVCFFIFAGNMARLPAVRALFSNLLTRNTLLTSILSCQVISNVPSAILLSQFTDNYRALLLGVNIGGTGTLIASLASLITFRTFSANYPDGVKDYLLRFTAFNVGFLVILTLVASLLC